MDMFKFKGWRVQFKNSGMKGLAFSMLCTQQKYVFILLANEFLFAKTKIWLFSFCAREEE